MTSNILQVGKAFLTIKPGVCRICLDVESRLILISKELKDTWSKLTGIQVNQEIPLMACYICYAHLQRCDQLRKRALQAEALLTEMINGYNYRNVNHKYLGFIDRKSDILRYNYSSAKTEVWVSTIPPPNVSDDTTDKIKLELDDLEEGDACKNLQGSKDEQIVLKEEILAQNIEGDACVLEEKYSVPAEGYLRDNLHETLKTSNEFLLDNLKEELVTDCQDYPDNQLSSVTNTSFLEIMKSPDAENKTIGFYNDLNQYETIANDNIRNPTMLPNKVKKIPCKECSKKTDSEIRVKCNSTNSDECFNSDYKRAKVCSLTGTVENNTQNKSFVCQLCNCRYLTQSCLNKHVDLTHTEEKPLCCICHKRFTNKFILKAHMQTHTKEIPLSSNVCNDEYYKNHHLNKLKKQFTCNICQYRCFDKQYLVQHMRKHIKERPFRCVICNATYHRKISLQTHIKFKHEKKRESRVC